MRSAPSTPAAVAPEARRYYQQVTRMSSSLALIADIAMATLGGFTLPGDVSASSRYWAEDIIDPPVSVSARGTITPPDSPGIGYAVNLSRIEALTVRKEIIK